MAATGRQFVIELIARTKGAQRSLDDFGQKFDKIKTPIVAGLAVVAAGFAAVTAATYRAVTAIVELGSEFTDAYRTIQAGTGATGLELERLEAAFRNVFATGADSMDDVASTMAELDSRFDTLSNRRLERLTRQFLDLGGLLGEDTVGLVQSLTAAFNRFDVPAHRAGETLDMLFRISQETGYSLSQLGGQTENYGVGLQRLGFNIEEAAAFLALLEREGISASRIFPSLNTAAGRLAQEGVGDIQTALADAIEQLRTLDQAAAEQKAGELLGSDFRNFLEVIRGGKIDVDLFIASLGDPTGAITSTAAETDGLREKWDTFKNYLKVTFEPAAMEVFDALSEMVDGLRPAVDRVREAFEEDGLEGALAQVAEEWDKIYENNIRPLWEGFLQFLNDYVKPIALELGKDIGNAIASGIWDTVTSALKPDIWELLLTGRWRPRDTTKRSLEDIRRELQIEMAPSIGTSRNDYGERTIMPSGPVIPMAAGGIVSSPTLALIGEAGPEAVIPLSEMNQYGGATVNVYVNGGDPAAVVDAIRRYTRTNGPLGQVVTL
ncbi:MAG TPA: phage tail tape measure protein [Acidimicrobiia bacterium]